MYSEKSLRYTVLMRRKHQKKVLQYIFGEVKEDERRAKSDADIVKIGNEEKFFDKFEKR